MPTAKKRPSLGRGFDSLLPQNFDETLLLNAADKIEKLAVGLLYANQYQPRRDFDEEALGQLADSIRQYGVLQPVVVTAAQDGKYMLIAGERRWRASQLAGLETIPAIVRSTHELEQLEIALIENVQRVDLSPLEQAASIQYLHQQFGVSYDEISKRLGKASSTVHNIVRLLNLPARALEALRSQTITEGHARAVLALKEWPHKQEILLDNIIAKGWSVRQAEQFVVSVKQGFHEAKQTQERMQTQTPATKLLSKKLHTPVFIRRTAHGGKLEVAFSSDEQLEKILNLLNQK